MGVNTTEVRAHRTGTWLASYALGLASARYRPASCIDGIIEQAGTSASRLAAARRQLASVDVIDEDLRARAHAMLSIAIVSVGVDRMEASHA